MALQYEDRRDHSTRDTAVEAKSLINQHMVDCATFRERLNDMFSDIRSDHKEFRAELKTLSTRTLLIMGGLIVAGKVMDWGTPFVETLFRHQ